MTYKILYLEKQADWGDIKGKLKDFYEKNPDLVHAGAGAAGGGLLYRMAGGRGALGTGGAALGGGALAYLLGREESPVETKTDRLRREKAALFEEFERLKNAGDSEALRKWVDKARAINPDILKDSEVGQAIGVLDPTLTQRLEETVDKTKDVWDRYKVMAGGAGSTVGGAKAVGGTGKLMGTGVTKNPFLKALYPLLTAGGAIHGVLDSTDTAREAERRMSEYGPLHYTAEGLINPWRGGKRHGAIHQQILGSLKDWSKAGWKAADSRFRWHSQRKRHQESRNKVLEAIRSLIDNNKVDEARDLFDKYKSQRWIQKHEDRLFKQ